MSMNWPTMKMRHHKFKDFRVEQNMGKLNRLPKGDVPILMRKLSALQSYVGGIKYMLLKIVIIVGKKNNMAFQECTIFGSLTIYLIDKNCNQNLVDISILANKASIQLILNKLLFAILRGLLSLYRKPLIILKNKK